MAWLLLGVAVVSALISGGIVHRFTEDYYEGKIASEARQFDKIKKENDERIFKLAADLEVAKNTKRVEYEKTVKYITKIVERPVYLRECIDDDGLRTINETIAGGPLPPSEPSATVPAGNATGGEDGQGALAKNDRVSLPPK